MIRGTCSEKTITNNNVFITVGEYIGKAWLPDHYPD